MGRLSFSVVLSDSGEKE